VRRMCVGYAEVCAVGRIRFVDERNSIVLEYVYVVTKIFHRDRKTEEKRERERERERGIMRKTRWRSGSFRPSFLPRNQEEILPFSILQNQDGRKNVVVPRQICFLSERDLDRAAERSFNFSDGKIIRIFCTSGLSIRALYHLSLLLTRRSFRSSAIRCN